MELPENWKETNHKLIRDYVFKDFKTAWAFMSAGALAAEEQCHHPEWTNVWNKVHIELCTHDAGKTVTNKDRKLAETFEKFASKLL